MRFAYAVLLALSTAACGDTFMVAMPRATPDLIVRPRSSATFFVEPGQGVNPVCLDVGLDVLCVRGLRQELGAGVSAVLESFLTPGGPEEAQYVARLGAISINVRSSGKYGPHSLVVDWQFTLDDAQGRHIVRLRDTTVGSIPIGDGRSALTGPLEGVENDVLERIRSAIGDSVVAHPSPTGS